VRALADADGQRVPVPELAARRVTDGDAARTAVSRETDAVARRFAADGPRPAIGRTAPTDPVNRLAPRFEARQLFDEPAGRLAMPQGRLSAEPRSFAAPDRS
jgi:hypothetical protein